jgi:hypothetical protein
VQHAGYLHIADELRLTAQLFARIDARDRTNVDAHFNASAAARSLTASMMAR